MQINFELKEQPVRLSGQIETVIEVDRNWTAEALTNILKNASEHGPIGKAIEIRVIDGPMTTAIEITNEGKSLLKICSIYLHAFIAEATRMKTVSASV